MSNAVINVCNQALSLVGADGNISSLSEDTQNARICNLWFNDSRDYLLTSFPWKFALQIAGYYEEWDSEKYYNWVGDLVSYNGSVYRSLKENNQNNLPTDTEWWELTEFVPLTLNSNGNYNIPSNCLRVFNIDNGSVPFKVIGDEIQIEHFFHELLYIKKCDELTGATKMFTRALAYHLAMEMSTTLATETRRQLELQEQYRKFVLPEALSIDSFQNQDSEIISNDWTNSRY